MVSRAIMPELEIAKDVNITSFSVSYTLREIEIFCFVKMTFHVPPIPFYRATEKKATEELSPERSEESFFSISEKVV
jgi:hypothetical protein